jgi:pyruvate,orthophosphate dikinase
MELKKRVYFFGNKTSEGNESMRELLGGKGANLAEMNLIGIPVPPGFTITTEVCNEYFLHGREKITEIISGEVKEAMHRVEMAVNGPKFADNNDPLLVSVRSGARASMPGMMDTILNLGLNDNAVEIISQKSGNPRFAWDSYRRFVQMYGDVVLGMKPENKEDQDPFEQIIDEMKKEKNVALDTELSADDLKELVKRFKAAVKEKTGNDFPSDPWQQLWRAVMAVFDSWMNDRAILYRKLNKIPQEWGTAVNVQSMVFGNMGDRSATGVAFTRDAATGENIFNGEYLINAQGEDVVAGIRTPQQITMEGSRRWAKFKGISEEKRKAGAPSLEETMPEVYNELAELQQKLETHYRDMQDLEFTVQDGKLWMLQTRNAKRTGAAAIKVAMDMLEHGILKEDEAVLRIEPEKIDELLHPVFDSEELRQINVIIKGLPASPGAASGQIVFFADDAEQQYKDDNDAKLILVRTETSPEDLRGMNVAQGILTARGGMTSHAAVVARGMGKCCVSGASGLDIDYKRRIMTIDGKIYEEGAWISLNGSTGEVYEGKVKTKPAEPSDDFSKLMKLSEKYAHLQVRANADTPEDAATARKFGAEGIGLCRTEHMFFKEDKIVPMREMILAETNDDRRNALNKLLPLQQKDFEEIFAVMHDLPVIVRLLDPPLHEFLPHDAKGQEEMSKVMNVPVEIIRRKVESLHETNPMLGHRGCRLANTYPEITEMQTRAILQAVLTLKKKGIHSIPEIMVPLTGILYEMKSQEEIIRTTAEKVFLEMNDRTEYKIGSMIEVPRAALTADRIAESAEFFSFGTNDLTQLTYGYSRDDISKFLPIYLEKGILKTDPFQILDRKGVGQLISMATLKGRSIRPLLKVGICGEHGGEPSSVEFCHAVGLNYVSCSPYRVPVARLAAAQAAIKSKK